MKAIAKYLSPKNDDCIICGNGKKAICCCPSQLFAVKVGFTEGDNIVCLWSGLRFTVGKIKHMNGFFEIIDKKGAEVGHIITLSTKIPMNKQGVFKVLGEISKNATWVKDGDEIEIRTDTRCTIPECTCNISNIDSCKNSVIDKIQVKCPTCQTYH